MLNWARQNTKVLLFILAGALMLFFVFGVHDALAQVEQLATTGALTGLGTEDPRLIIAKIVRIALGFVGVIAVVLVMYGGFLWMTSNGDAAKITKARGVLINAGIGIVIILSSLMITQFIINSLVDAVNSASGVSDNAAPEIINPFSAALGNGVVGSHYPTRNGRDVPRNTNIVVSFREPIFPGSVMIEYADGDDSTIPLLLNTDAVKVYETELDTPVVLGNINVVFSADHKSMVLDPQDFLGNAESNVGYTVELTDQILLDTLDTQNNRNSAFTGRFSDGYQWRFTTSTIVDTTPPAVTSVVPVRDTENPRNILIQINYSEPINPVTASGFNPDSSSTPDFTNIRAEDTNGIISGEWKLVNQFKSSEFIPTETCGMNSCGEEIYCLPPKESIRATVQAPDVGPEPPAAILPANGITDMAGNALDGDSDGTAEGTVVDDYWWDFTTTGELIRVAPIISSVSPSLSSGIPASGIEFDQPITVTFNSLMQLSSINSDNITLHSQTGNLWYSFDSETVSIPDASSSAIPPPMINVARTTINHGIFTADKVYGAEVMSQVRSVYQNCFAPSYSSTCFGNDLQDNCCNEELSAEECIYPIYGL